MHDASTDTSAAAPLALVMLHVAVALFGFAALFGEWIALPATQIVLGRTAIGAATLYLVARIRRRGLQAASPALFANGAILALHWVTFFAAVQRAGVAFALLGYAIFPVFVLLLGRGVDGPLRPRDYVSTVLACAGLVAIVPEPSWSSEATRGLVLGLVSGFAFAWLAVRNRRFVATRPAIGIAFWQNLFAAACLAPFALVGAGGIWHPRTVALLFALGVVCTGVAHTLFIASLRRVRAQTAGVIAALEPVYGIALAVLFLREIPGPRTVAGGLLIVVAAIVASQRRSRVAGRRALSVASNDAEDRAKV